MIAWLGRSIINRLLFAVIGFFGLPSPRFLIALTTLGACAAFYSRRTAIAVVLIAVTALIAYGALAVRNAGLSAPDRPGPRSSPPATQQTSLGVADPFSGR